VWCVRRLAVIFALALAGCGGGSHKPAATPTPTRTPTPAVASANCPQLRQAAAQVAQALTGATGKPSDRAKHLLDKLAGSAPQEIRGDVRTIDDAYSRIVAALKSSGGATDVQKLQSALAKVDASKLSAAGDRIDRWVRKHC
jgi:hypothetical protein